MKRANKILAKWLPVIGMSAALSACGDKRASSDVETSLVFTGSSQQSTVAQNFFEKITATLIPSAVALTPPSLVDSNGVQVTLSDAWIVVKEIEFKAEEMASASELEAEAEGKDANEIKFKGPYYINLLSDSPSPLDSATIPEQAYRRIRMKLHKAESSAAPAEAPAGLSNNSIYLKGTVGGVEFTYSSEDGAEVEISGPNGVTPSASQDMLVVLRLADLFKKISLASITSTTTISSSSKVEASNACPAIKENAENLYDCFRKGIESEADFGKDRGTHDLGQDDERVKD